MIAIAQRSVAQGQSNLVGMALKRDASEGNALRTVGGYQVPGVHVSKHVGQGL